MLMAIAIIRESIGVILYKDLLIIYAVRPEPVERCTGNTRKARKYIRSWFDKLTQTGLIGDSIADLLKFSAAESENNVTKEDKIMIDIDHK